MISFCFILLLILFIIGLLLYFWDLRYANKQKISKEGNSVNNLVRINHLKIYVLALFIEWIQEPYLFRLYADYCEFNDHQIALLYVVGLLLTPFFLPFSSILLNYFDTSYSIMLLSANCGVSLILKSFRPFYMQLLSRILNLISIANIYSCIDEWIMVEMKKNLINSNSTGNGKSRLLIIIESLFQLTCSTIAILAGVIADILAERLNLGIPSPYYFGLIPTCGLIYLVYNYKKYYSNNRSIDSFSIDQMVNEECICGSNVIHKKSLKCYIDGIKDTLNCVIIYKRYSLILCSIYQSLIDCSIFIFMMSWTPMLEYTISKLNENNISIRDLPLGIIFSCFMAGLMIGGMIFQFLSNYAILPTKTLTVVTILLSILAFLLSNLSPIHRKIGTKSCMFILVAIEILFGLYTPAIQWLRQHSVPPEIGSNNFRLYVIYSSIKIPVNFLIIFCIIIPLLPKSLYEVDVVDPDKHIYRFHIMNPTVLFLAFCIMSIISAIIVRLLHKILSVEIRHYGRSRFSNFQFIVSTDEFRY